MEWFVILGLHEKFVGTSVFICLSILVKSIDGEFQKGYNNRVIKQKNTLYVNNLGKTTLVT